MFLTIASGLNAQAPSSMPGPPSSTPDRIILSWTEDPAATMSVTWRTDVRTTRSAALIAPATDAPGFKNAKEVTGEVNRFDGVRGGANIHTVRFRGLQPATEYAYRVGDGAHGSEWRRFRTAAKGDAPLTFLYTGDAQTGLLTNWARAVSTGMERAPDARFVVYAGDLVNRGTKDDQWGEWFHAAAPMLATIPSLPAPGDHEYTSFGGLGHRLPDHWRAQFDLPRNGLSGLEETSYYLDVQGVRVVILNSSERTEEQARWLDQILAAGKPKWSVVVLHHPVFTVAEGRNNKGRQEIWQPVLDKHNVDLVLQGHDHVYTRSGLIHAGNFQSTAAGTVYVTAVAGAKAYPAARQPWMRAFAQNTSTIQAVHIDGNSLWFTAWAIDGKVVDSFELVKRPGGEKSLRENRASPGTAP